MDKSELIIGKTYFISYREPDYHLYEGRAELVKIFVSGDYPYRFRMLNNDFDHYIRLPLSAIIHEVVPTRIVICANDYPYAIFPEGATEEQARIKCAALQLADKWNNDDKTLVYYHWHVLS